MTFAAGTNNAPITFNGATTLLGYDTLTLTNTGGMYFNGQVSGSGQLVTAGAGTVFLTNTNASNSFSGGVSLGGTATVVVSDANALGSGTIGFNGATLVPSNPITFTNPYLLNANTTLSGTSSANNLTFSGAGTLTASVTLIDNNTGTVTFSGNLGEEGGARALTIEGPGTLALTPTSGANTYSGGTTIASTAAGNVAHRRGSWR